MAYIVITEEEKLAFVERYIDANEKDILSRFKVVSEAYMAGDNRYRWEAVIAGECVECVHGKTVIDPYMVANEAFDGCDNVVIPQLVFETDDWDHWDLIGEDEWNVEDVNRFVRTYLPEFDFEGRIYVSDRVDVLPDEEDDGEDFDQSQTDFDFMADLLGSEEESRLFWESAI